MAGNGWEMKIKAHNCDTSTCTSDNHNNRVATLFITWPY